MPAELSLSVAVPLFNEQENVEEFAGKLVRVLTESVPDHEIILVDNGSSDNTNRLIDICTSRFPTIRKVAVPVNRGYGWGIITGLRAARGEIIGWIDGDNEVPPETVVGAYRFLQEAELDLCCGQVLTADRSCRRKAVSAMFLLLFNLLYLSRYRSINGKPKLFRSRFLRPLGLSSHDWFIDAELMIKAKRLNLKTGFFPFQLNIRKGGESNVNWRTIREFVSNLVIARIKKP
ncbi:MAG TPA: glycosyltransferase family 2 protein [bacterium]|nr:glycosyltransferase family 2 protein [bacterium]HPJ71227.1 glycosyltransferase family 2 protein [bacterium]